MSRSKSINCLCQFAIKDFDGIHHDSRCRYAFKGESMGFQDEKEEMPVTEAGIEEPVVNVAIIKIGQTEIGLECIGDQIIILEDKFRTGYECSKCDGEGYTSDDCKFCKGSGKENIGTTGESPCRMCCPPDMFISGNTQPGKQLCPLCEGKGAVIIAPQSSQMKPTSGVIKSVGPDVSSKIFTSWESDGSRKKNPYPLKVGDRVLYSQFAGTGIALKQKDFIRIMHAHEIMCKIYGTGRLGDFVK